ncbi:DUF1758 domain-containing protein [Trichonephila inaurata madagascariensis]|uniref:DUF1758 domain-containing protein n=1 Tax=Trichonephila inaurata madagascariensis TaxID=2747483 RepID=A0A8X6IXQ8_9ARAC|nr:DUF1758 domain-containing protein [Trichonephila inaurata madagascariensis]
MIRLQNRDKEVCVRALLDYGSQRSYIEKNLAAELFLSPSGSEIFSQGLFGGGISPASEHKRYMMLEEIHHLPIRVLLGADILGSILTGRIEVLSSEVSAVETLLGWTILGLGKKREIVNLVTLRELAKYGPGHPALYDKYDTAESRLRTATKRLINENYFEAYDNVFQQWELDGVIEAVPIDQLAKEVHYLPHRPVIKPSSNTTKVRRVFDASFKKPGFASLNECLSVGPSLIHKILPLLLRLRFGAIGVIADVKQAFLQIRLRTDVLRFLWWENAECSKIRIYHHCRVVFGVSSGPFQLNATISYHLEREKFQTESLRKTIGHLKEGFYVDNLVTSVKDVTELEQLKSQSIEIMKGGAFELRCWASNDSKEDQDMQMVLGLS